MPANNHNRRKAGAEVSLRTARVEIPEGRPGAGYCQSCGRLLPNDTRTDPTPRRYCSNSCRTHAKSPHLKPIRRDLIQSFHRRLIDASLGPRAMVLCSEVERDVFSASTSTQAQQQSNAAAAAAASDSTLASDDDAHGESKVRARLEPAEQREEARRAARRLVAFGFRSQGVMDEQREVEAVQENGGRIVETSFAKGEWGLRWK